MPSKDPPPQGLPPSPMKSGSGPPLLKINSSGVGIDAGKSSKKATYEYTGPPPSGLPPAPKPKVSSPQSNVRVQRGSSTEMTEAEIEIAENERRIADIQRKLAEVEKGKGISTTNMPPQGLKPPGPPTNIPPKSLRPPGPPPLHYKKSNSTYMHSSSSTGDNDSSDRDRGDTFQEIDESVPIPMPSPTSGRTASPTQNMKRSQSILKKPRYSIASSSSGPKSSKSTVGSDKLDTIFDDKVTTTAKLAPTAPKLLAVAQQPADRRKKSLSVANKRRQTNATAAGDSQYTADVKEFTESTITKERISDGGFAKRSGMLLIFNGCLVCVLSIYFHYANTIVSVIDVLVSEKIVITSAESELYGDFVNPENIQETFNKFYFFNVKNPSEILAGTAKPDLEQVGPYVYQERLIRSKISFSEDKLEVSYTNVRQQTFIEDDMYLVFPDDLITLPSVSYTKAMYLGEGYGLTGDEYYLINEVSRYFQKMKTKYTVAAGKTYNDELFGNTFDYNVPDYIWRKFIPEVIYDMVNWIHDNPTYGSGYIFQTNSADEESFISKWAGNCNTYGCLSSLPPPSGQLSGTVINVMDPKLCPSYVEYAAPNRRCQWGSSDVIYPNAAAPLWDTSPDGGEQPFSFMSSMQAANGELQGIFLWLSEEDEYKGRLTYRFDGIGSSAARRLAQYDVIRKWIIDLSSSDEVFSRLKQKFGSFVGSSISDSRKSFINTSIWQWGTGKIMGRGAGVRSIHDADQYTPIDLKDWQGMSYSERSAQSQFRVGSGLFGKQQTSGSKYDEFGVWTSRNLGVDLSLSLSDSRNLLNFLADDSPSGMWSLFGGSNELGPSSSIPGVTSRVTQDHIRSYINYIRDTFIAPKYADNNDFELFQTREAQQWITGFSDPVTDFYMTSEDPRSKTSLLSNQVNIYNEDSDVTETEKQTAECLSNVDRQRVTADFDMCKTTAVEGVWHQKPNTYLTGLDSVVHTGQMTSFRGYKSIPSSVWGSELSMTSFRGNSNANVEESEDHWDGDIDIWRGVSDGVSFAALNVFNSESNEIPVFMEDLVHPLFFSVVKNRVVVGKLGCRRLGLMGENLVDLYGKEIAGTAEGLLDMRGGTGFPLLISQPHFFGPNSDLQEKWVSKFKGLESGNKDMHDSFIDVHSQTGKAVSSQIKLQYNLMLPPKEGAFQILNTVASGSSNDSGDSSSDPGPAGGELIIPVFWLHKDTNLTETGNLQLFSANVNWLFWLQFMLITGAFTICTVSFCTGWYCIRKGVYMTNNPSMRVNEAALRYQQSQLNIERAKQEEKERRRKEKKARKELEMKIQSVQEVAQAVPVNDPNVNLV